jgi:hypothetical protein
MYKLYNVCSYNYCLLYVVCDVRNLFGVYIIQKEKMTKFIEDSPKFLGNFEKLLIENGQESFFVGNKVGNIPT